MSPLSVNLLRNNNQSNVSHKFYTAHAYSNAIGKEDGGKRKAGEHGEKEGRHIESNSNG